MTFQGALNGIEYQANFDWCSVVGGQDASKRFGKHFAALSRWLSTAPVWLTCPDGRADGGESFRRVGQFALGSYDQDVGGLGCVAVEPVAIATGKRLAMCCEA